MIPFRFDTVRHEYRVEGALVPHITGMLLQAGIVDDRWYTEECKRRGSAVHTLTTDYDLGALDLATCVAEFKPYLAQHARAMRLLSPEFLHIEVPFVHREFRFGGRPDRVLKLFGAKAVMEIKSGALEPQAHGVQLALQAILVAEDLGLPPLAVQRFGLYLTPRTFKVEHFVNAADFTTARKVIRQCCGV